jgi:uncharacterized protein DUF7033
MSTKDAFPFSAPAGGSNGSSAQALPAFVPSAMVRDPIVHVQRISPRVGITPQARCYAIKELARRAGVAPDWQKMWNIRVGDHQTVVDLDPEKHLQIVFPHASPELLKSLSRGRFATVRRRWMLSPQNGHGAQIGEFPIPFAGERNSIPKPLFVPRGSGRIECTVDLPLSVLLTLSRWEETVIAERDTHGRFPASQGIAARDGFLHRPVVDEWALGFQQALEFLVPGWHPLQRKLRAKLSHDVDHIGLPFRWRNALRHAIRHNRPKDSIRDVLSAVFGTDPTEMGALRNIVSLSIERKLDCAVYWKASLPGPLDSGYDPRHAKVRDFVHWLSDHQIESGFHPGYETYHAPVKLRRELLVLRDVLGEERALGGRQHYLRWSPQTWIHWEACGLSYDSTVGFAERIGFRAGTCIPYRPWLFALNRESTLLEIPLLVMDCTLLEHMKLGEQEALQAVTDCIDRCQMVGGVFTLNWHNNNFLEPRYQYLFEKLLPLLEGAEHFDWRGE